MGKTSIEWTNETWNPVRGCTRAQGEPEEVHPCDESLGNIHQCAISLQMAGQHELAVLLATAHETIQTYLLSEMAERERLSKENGELAIALRELLRIAALL